MTNEGQILNDMFSGNVPQGMQRKWIDDGQGGGWIEFVPIRRQFRCTRALPYSNAKCPGFKHLSARQGYYIRATDEADALSQMRVKFPFEVDFTATPWND